MNAIRRLTSPIQTIANLAERCGERCGGPVILAGLVVGLGVVQLTSGPLGLTSRFSLELLVLLVLQLVGPMLVALLALALLLPRWIERYSHTRSGMEMEDIAAAAVVGALLQLLFLAAAMCGGVLGTPRSDLVGELRDLLGGVLLIDVARACLRAGVFLAAVCGWSQWRSQRNRRLGHDAGRLVSDQLAEGLVLLLSLKLLWIGLIDPLHLSTSPS
jgi:hypothetical protein